MKNYKVVYQYLMEGEMIMEAKSEVDVKRSYLFQDLGSNSEHLVNNKLIKVELIK